MPSPELTLSNVTVDTTVNKPVLNFTANFTDTNPISFTVRDTLFGMVNDADLKIELAPRITNNSGANWWGFRINLVDASTIQQDATHPFFAHFHDSTLSGWEPLNGGSYTDIWGYNKSLNILQQPPFPGSSTVNGANVLQFWASVFGNQTMQNWSGIGVHEVDKADGTQNNVTYATGMFTVVLTPILAPTPPPAGTSADMIAREGDGVFEIYDIGNNMISAGYQLGQVGMDWQFAGLGGFFGGDTTDMLLRNGNTGGFEVYDISNNQIMGAAFLGTVGMDWQVMGFGNFSSFGETDMIMRNTKTGGVEVYDIRNNQIIGAAFMGTVGLDWQVAGFGNHGSETDMILRNTKTGGLEIYDINSNQITGAAFLGTVGLDWQVLGFGNFSSQGTGDMIMRNTKTGGLEVYDISNNQITGAAFLGTVGLDWQFAGVAPVHAPGATDLVLRNVNTGQFEVYDIANNQIIGAALLGQVGLEWQLQGFAVDPPMGSMASIDDSGNQLETVGSTSQLVQAMASFDSNGAGEVLNAMSDTVRPQEPILATPTHA